MSAPENDPAHFLKIASQGAGISTHQDLWRWLQGDVQQWLQHDVMLVGWGDFRTSALHFDIISSQPGMRSHDWTLHALAPLISYFRDCWIAAQQQPCELDVGACANLVADARRNAFALDKIPCMSRALVHGIAGSRHGSERIFAAVSREPFTRRGAGTALKLLLPFMDSAMRRMPSAPSRIGQGDTAQADAARLAALSGRERQIMGWVAMGKTNPEIGSILSISEFTVKNHLKNIFCKLDVSNRAQAVSTLSLLVAHA
ncbi:XrtB/PEP-CTERM-associated transcriptional regulator EpsA [Caenimonas sp. SL110]|uniref:XrtB/PEP-CTERM-associated transcriptional regulator EpsA n=1 Tax=Caenimonas sp. SL110 TaxID=1450524 RepID=UPI00069DF318|nr:XrtB/PEP-CTERM-associated transcriptional regulator EpsA [Caenimonas sp. SL110]